MFVLFFCSSLDHPYYKEGIELYKNLETLKARKYNIPMEWWAWSNALHAIFAPANKPMIVLESEICNTEKAWYYKLFAENKAIGWVVVPNPKHDSYKLDKTCLDFGLKKLI